MKHAEMDSSGSFPLHLAAYVFIYFYLFIFFGGVIMPPFVALQGLWLLFNQPVCMNHQAHIVSAACYLPTRCEPDAASLGPRPQPTHSRINMSDAFT